MGLFTFADENASARRALVKWYRTCELQPTEDVAQSLFYLTRIHPDDIGHLKSWCKNLDDALCELFYLRIFLCTFGVWLLLGESGKHLSDAIFNAVFAAVPRTEGLKLELYGRITRYAEAYSAPDRNPLMSIGSVYAELCGAGSDVRATIMASVMAGAELRCVSDFLHKIYPEPKRNGEAQALAAQPQAITPAVVVNANLVLSLSAQGKPARQESGTSKECPKCRLINPASGMRCDCGYDFVSRTIKTSYLEPRRLSEGDVTWFEKVFWGFSYSVVKLALSFGPFFLMILTVFLVIGVAMGLSELFSK